MKKEERNLVYRIMLKAYRQAIKLSELYGFCSLLNPYSYPGLNLTKEEVSLLEETDMIDLVELISFKPNVFYSWWGDKSSSSEQFWFPVKDTETRIRILKECIELTN